MEVCKFTAWTVFHSECKELLGRLNTRVYGACYRNAEFSKHTQDKELIENFNF